MPGYQRLGPGRRQTACTANLLVRLAEGRDGSRGTAMGESRVRAFAEFPGGSISVVPAEAASVGDCELAAAGQIAWI